MESYRALVVTDIVDSTRISEELGTEEAARLWARHDIMARNLLQTWNGSEIERTDGILAIFDRLADAIHYAIHYHRALASTGLPLIARAAINIGAWRDLHGNTADDDLDTKPSRVDGLAISVAARLVAIAQGGQTLMPAEAAAALGPTAFRMQTHGHWRLKGVAQPIEVFEVGDRDATFTPPLDDIKAYRVVRARDLWVPVRDIPHSLPAERDAFVGRADWLALIGRKFLRGARLISIIGIGGAGKTRLALRYAWTWLGDFPGGAWFCDLSQARTLDDILFAVAQGLGISLDNTDPSSQICRVIAGRGKCLVILDNFEQVAALAEETLGRWMDFAPDAAFIATTREALRIVGEESLYLEPLSTEDATGLFIRRAESARQDYRPGTDDLEAIRALVKRLDCLPLAVELAAARVRVLPPRALLARWHERVDLLSAPGRRLGRQATLRAAFDWSWELLADVEKAALAKLSVFQGGFTLQAACAVLDPDRATNISYEAVIESLLAKSFVQQINDHRFHLLETVRQYAEDQLQAEDGFPGGGPQAADQAIRRHWSYFSTLRGVGPAGVPPDEVNNLVTACRRATDMREGHAAVGCLLGAWEILRLTGPSRVGADLADRVQTIPDLNQVDRALTHWVGGSALELMGAVDSAREHFIAGLHCANASGEPGCKARLLMALGARQTVDGDLQQAYENLTEADRLADGLQDLQLQAQVLNSLGRLMDYQSRIQEARAVYEKALSLARQLDDRRLQGGLLGNLGGLHLDLGHLDAAREHYLKALALAREVGDRRWEGNNLSNLGLLSKEEFLLEEARVQFEDALKVSREIGHVSLEYTVLCNLGIVLEAEGRIEQAAEHYEQAVAAAERSADRRSEGQFRGYLAIAYAKLGRSEDARLCLSKGEGLLLGMSDQLSYAVLKCQHAELEKMAGETELALMAYELAERVAQSLNTGLDSELGRRLAALGAQLKRQPPPVSY